MPLLRILEKMHTLKYLHRDIKPENIFLTAAGKVKLGDFGLAIKCDEELAFSRSGTLDYMAPEVRRAGCDWKAYPMRLELSERTSMDNRLPLCDWDGI